jgi:subtilisin-like proprotein convertase family protein
VFLSSITFSVCSSSGTDEFAPTDFEGFIDQKEDTGYLGNKAAELEAKLTSKVYIDMTGKTPEEIQEKADSLLTASRWELGNHTTPQIKYARNPLKTEKLDLNLERGDTEIVSVETDENGVWLEFITSIESLVKFKELEEKGLTPADMVGVQIDFVLPILPETIWDKGGLACATDFDSGGDPNPDDVHDYNYFYYFDPLKEGCPLKQDEDLITARYEILSSLDTPSVYPEYDLLTQDKQITMVALFGQIKHGELESNDWGWIGYRDFKRYLNRTGFNTIDTFENDYGIKLKKTYSGDLDVIVRMYTPEALKDGRPRDEVNELFKEEIKNNEIVYYNGHAFYGSLSVLDRQDAYPENTYQIINMDACWSYAYYTKQVFENKTTEEDPDGMKYADVVNNTEPAISGSHETAWLLYKNIFKAASNFVRGRSTAKYSWNNLIVYMNDSAEERARYYDPEKFHAEIYGVSGVATNCFNPNGPSFCQDTGDSSLVHNYKDTSPEASIPDYDGDGVSKTIQVEDSYTIENVAVDVTIRHSYIGDLVVSVTHEGKSFFLHNREGGGSNDIMGRFSTDLFNGMDVAGDWTIRVTDNAEVDTGKLANWSLIITEVASDPEVINIENTDLVDIPDNDATGITSTINVPDDVQIKEINIKVDITHSYIGDLIIVLEHGDISEVLTSRQGGSTDDINETFYPQTFSSSSSQGDWVLKVSDHAGIDTGTLNSWSITIVPTN